MKKDIDSKDTISEGTLHEILLDIKYRLDHLEDIEADNRALIVKLIKQSNSVVKLHDGTGTGGALEFQAKFGAEGLDIFVPGSGIRFKTGVYLDLDQTDSVTIGYTG